MKTLLLALFLLLPFTSVQAAENACGADIQKFCKGVKPGPDLNKCMSGHGAELSQGCKDQAAAAMAHANPCAADIQKFCKAVKPGPDLDKCMKGHDAEISKGCKDQVAAARAHFAELGKEVHAACQSDVDKFCKGKDAANGDLSKCMHDHHGDLSTNCTTAMAKR